MAEKNYEGCTPDKNKTYFEEFIEPYGDIGKAWFEVTSKV